LTDRELFEEYTEASQTLKPGERNDELFSAIATRMQSRGRNVCGAVCESRWKHLQDVFRVEFDKSEGTGREPSKWPLYESFKAAMGMDVNMTAPFLVSAGTISLVKRGGLCVQDTPARSRERPPTSTRVRKEAQVKKLVGAPLTHQARSFALQERRLALNERYVEEISAIRRTLERRQESFAAGLAALSQMGGFSTNLRRFDSETSLDSGRSSSNNGFLSD
jgi:hypothetical protein